MEEGFRCSLLLIGQYAMNSYRNYSSLHSNLCWWACEIVLKHKPTLHLIITSNPFTSALLDSGVVCIHYHSVLLVVQPNNFMEQIVWACIIL